MVSPAAGSRRIKVLVVDDHVLFAESLVLALSVDERIEPVGFADGALEGVALAERLEPDVVLMDLQMPGVDGVDATRMLGRLCPDVRVLVVTASTSREDAERARAAGALSVLGKDTPTEILLDAVHGAAGPLTCAA